MDALFSKKSYWCKYCCKQYRILNKIKLKEKKKKYLKSNKKNISEKRHTYYLNNKDKLIKIQAFNNACRTKEIKEYQKNYNEIEYVKKHKKIYMAEYQKKYRLNRRVTDISFILRLYVSSAISTKLKNNNSSKNGKSCIKYIGYVFDNLKQHLECLFESWMNWNNYGIYNKKTWDDNNPLTWKWQIDHIIPHSTFKYTSMEDQSFKDCWVLSNLRPLSAKQNILDGINKIRH
jgi:hypothetical protein